MNTDTVRELASQIDSTARDLRSIDSSIERVMENLARQWEGGDYQRFRGWWRDQHRPSLHRLVDSIEGLARSARYNADDQDRASAQGQGGSGSIVVPRSAQLGGSGVSDLPMRLFERFKDATDALDGSLLLLGLSGSVIARRLLDGGDWAGVRLLSSHAQRGFLRLTGQHVSQAVHGRIGGYTAAANNHLGYSKAGTSLAAAVGGFSWYMNRREYGGGDARTVEAQVDGFISTAASRVPGGALVYGGTRALSELIVDEAEERWDMSGRVANDYVQRAYGVSSVEDLTPAQLDEYTERYSGLSGLWNSTGDQIIAGGRGTGNAIKRGWNSLFGG
jgi:WXG100 family type VII secretion target